MNDKRIIKVNPELFKIPDKTRKNRKPAQTSEIKMKEPKKQENNSTLKRKLLQIIRNKQNEKIDKEKHNGKNANQNDVSKEFDNEFQESLNYLTDISKKNENKIHVNTTLKSHIPIHENVHIELPKELLENEITPHINENMSNVSKSNIKLPSPEYGCLKNGMLPTYRSWKNHTQKNYNKIIDERSQMSTIKQKQNLIKNTNVQPVKKCKRQRKIIRRNFTIGRSTKKPLLSVLVSNRTLRNQTSTKQKLLQQTPIDEIKKFLIKRGFIKIGSIAPNDVLRQMYECSMMMCGDIKNHNPDNLLYNYLHQSNDN